jgi:AraC-like DNA-binding protein
LTDRPDPASELLSHAPKRIRISGSMQYWFMPRGDWTADASPAPRRRTADLRQSLTRAGRAGASRAVLVARFTGSLGTSPVRYLRGRRLFLAAEDLMSPGRTIVIAATEAALIHAFTRRSRTPPAELRRARTSILRKDPA